VLILRLSQREALRADRHAAQLLGSAAPVIAMLEQVQADCRVLGVDADRWRRSDRLLATHPPVEARIRALSRSPERSRAGCPATSDCQRFATAAGMGRVSSVSDRALGLRQADAAALRRARSSARYTVERATLNSSASSALVCAPAA